MHVAKKHALIGYHTANLSLGFHLCKKQVFLMTGLILYTVKPVLSDHMKQDKCLAFQTGRCLFSVSTNQRK